MIKFNRQFFIWSRYENKIKLYILSRDNVRRGLLGTLLRYLLLFLRFLLGVGADVGNDLLLLPFLPRVGNKKAKIA